MDAGGRGRGPADLDGPGIALVPFSALGTGFLTGTVDPGTPFSPGDVPHHHPPLQRGAPAQAALV